MRETRGCYGEAAKTSQMGPGNDSVHRSPEGGTTNEKTTWPAGRAAWWEQIVLAGDGQHLSDLTVSIRPAQTPAGSRFSSNSRPRINHGNSPPDRSTPTSRMALAPGAHPLRSAALPGAARSRIRRQCRAGRLAERSCDFSADDRSG